MAYSSVLGLLAFFLLSFFDFFLAWLCEWGVLVVGIGLLEDRPQPEGGLLLDVGGLLLPLHVGLLLSHVGLLLKYTIMCA